MTRVLIVSKTRMGSRLCISGLTDSNLSIRLKPMGQRNHAQDTPFEIGQLWEMELREDPLIDPPHIEDVFITRQKYLGEVANLGSVLLKRVRPWVGDIEKIFDKKITIGYNRCYISRTGAIPSCSTGYWLPRRPLILRKDPSKENKYDYEVECDNLFNGRAYRKSMLIPFVGCVTPIENIHPNTLVRVSLARWFQPTDTTEERCYLQISGWYE